MTDASTTAANYITWLAGGSRSRSSATGPGRQAGLPWAAGVPGQVGPAEARRSQFAVHIPDRAPANKERAVVANSSKSISPFWFQSISGEAPAPFTLKRRSFSACISLMSMRPSPFVSQAANCRLSAGFHLVARDRAVAVSIKGQHQPDVLFLLAEGTNCPVGAAGSGRGTATHCPAGRRENEDRTSGSEKTDETHHRRPVIAIPPLLPCPSEREYEFVASFPASQTTAQGSARQTRP